MAGELREVGGGDINADTVAGGDGPHDGQGLDLHLHDLAGDVVVYSGGVAVVAVGQGQQAVADIVGHAVGVHLTDGVGEGGVFHVGADEEVGHQVAGQGGVLGQGLTDEADDVVAVAGGGELVAAPELAGGEQALAALGELGIGGIVDVGEGVLFGGLLGGEGAGGAVRLGGLTGQVVGERTVALHGEGVQVDPLVVAHDVGVHAGGGHGVVDQNAVEPVEGVGILVVGVVLAALPGGGEAEAVVPGTQDHVALGAGLLAEHVPGLDGALVVVVVVAAEDGHGHVDLGNGPLQVAPAALIPVGVGEVGVIDPVVVAFHVAAPQVVVGLDAGQVLGGLQIEVVVVHVGAVLHGPGDDVVGGHHTGVAHGEVPEHAVALGVEGLDLLRQGVAHDPGGEGQVGVAVHADALHPVLLVEPVQAGDAVPALVHVGHVLALGVALAAAVLIDVGKAALSVLLTQGVAGAVGPAGEGGGPGTLAHRLPDDGLQLHAVVHGKHDDLFGELVGLLDVIVVGADGVAGAGPGVHHGGGALTLHSHVGVQVAGQEIGGDVGAVVLEDDGGLHGALHKAHVGGAGHGLELDGPHAVGHGGGEGGLVPGYGVAQVLGDGPEGDILGAVLGEDGVAGGGGLGLGGQSRGGQGHAERARQQGGQELFLVHSLPPCTNFPPKWG